MHHDQATIRAALDQANTPDGATHKLTLTSEDTTWYPDSQNYLCGPGEVTYYLYPDGGITFRLTRPAPCEPEPASPITIDEATARVAEIQQQDCPESFHRMEDQLHQDVLRAIADGTAEDPCELARLALSTLDVDMERWYA